MLDAFSMSIPFGETGGLVRGCLDLVCGRFPPFVFGASVGDLLPVFHFHDEPRDALEPKLRYLAENGYRSINADEIAAFVRGDRTPARNAVALCFDDAWASVWTAAGPLLKAHGLTAIVYAIPARVSDAADCRLPGENGAAAGSPFMTWPELRALHATGIIDVQSHTHTHARIFTSPSVTGFVEPGYDATLLLARPRVGDEPLRFVDPDDLGAPLYEHRSRMSDGPRIRDTQAAHDACVRLVASEGGRAFFSRAGWRRRLQTLADECSARATPESDAEQQRAIDEELDFSRSELNARLGTRTVNHVCLPWGVSGQKTAGALKRLGFATAFANRFAGVHAVHRGDDPHWLKRLPNRYIHRLPGRGRRWWFLEPSSHRVTAGER
jgi:peptidoglycan/xylan/chitin deacetylase (PgdA/CDA1 family)